VDDRVGSAAVRSSEVPAPGPPLRFGAAEEVTALLKGVGYLADPAIATAVYLGDRLAKPVLVEGPAGTGKTELAKSVAAMTGTRLIRLQCYEGLDEAKALYEWDYRKQLLHIQARQNEADVEEDLFSERFLLTRPLLEAIRATEPVVLLNPRVVSESSEMDEQYEGCLSYFDVRGLVCSAGA